LVTIQVIAKNPHEHSFMKIVITDSGLGGLSICALYSQYLLASNYTGNFEIIYVNAAPKDDLGYNQMGTREEKLQTFNRVLYGIQYFYRPDYIFVACNTLSALIDDTFFAQTESTPIEGIIEIGVSLILDSLRYHHHSGIFIFGTDTTIEEKVYTQHLIKSNMQLDRIVECPLPGVATMISNDLEGNSVYMEIKRFVNRAISTIAESFSPLFIFLGCTHYGYRQSFFTEAFSELGYPETVILNPNEQAYQHLISKVKPEPSSDSESLEITIEFVSQYALPEKEVETLSHFLSSHSPQTVKALQDYTLKPDLLYPQNT